MIVCVCANKREREIIDFIRDGSTFEDLQKELGVCCNCCCCKEVLTEMIEKHGNIVNGLRS
jgi:bacterioferritin-associated ferredoxin